MAKEQKPKLKPKRHWLLSVQVTDRPVEGEPYLSKQDIKQMVGGEIETGISVKILSIGRQDTGQNG